MCRKCAEDWDDRKRMTKIAYRLLPKDSRESWLWNETPYPVALPTWDQIAESLAKRKVKPPFCNPAVTLVTPA